MLVIHPVRGTDSVSPVSSITKNLKDKKTNQEKDKKQFKTERQKKIFYVNNESSLVHFFPRKFDFEIVVLITQNN